MKKQSKYIFAGIVLAGFLGYMIAQQSTKSFKEISVQETKEKIQNDTSVVLLDVRTVEENKNERIANTPNIPVQELETRIHELDQYKNRPIIAYCRSGHRSGIAAELLSKHGFTVVSMKGGINQWKAEQFLTINGNSK